MLCPRCNAHNDEHSAFCIFCGMPLPPAEAEAAPFYGGAPPYRQPAVQPSQDNYMPFASSYPAAIPAVTDAVPGRSTLARAPGARKSPGAVIASILAALFFCTSLLFALLYATKKPEHIPLPAVSPSAGAHAQDSRDFITAMSSENLYIAYYKEGYNGAPLRYEFGAYEHLLVSQEIEHYTTHTEKILSACMTESGFRYLMGVGVYREETYFDDIRQSFVGLHHAADGVETVSGTLYDYEDYRQMRGGNSFVRLYYLDGDLAAFATGYGDSVNDRFWITQVGTAGDAPADFFKIPEDYIKVSNDQYSEARYK